MVVVCIRHVLQAPYYTTRLERLELSYFLHLKKYNESIWEIEGYDMDKGIHHKMRYEYDSHTIVLRLTQE